MNPAEIGPILDSDGEDAGNGSLMRLAPVAIFSSDPHLARLSSLAILVRPRPSTRWTLVSSMSITLLFYLFNVFILTVVSANYKII